MAFAGWHRVAEELRIAAASTDGHLNEGQRDSLRALADRIPSHGVLLADEVGMGKTRIAVRLARAVADAGGRVAILIPSTLGFQWQEELRRGGIANVPDVLRSLWGYLAAWSGQEPTRPWFREDVLLVSHGFVNWRLGASAQRWRYELLPMIAGLAQKARDGAFPYGFKAKSANADAWVWAASNSIADFCAGSTDATVRARYEELGRDTTWREANKGESYEQGQESRPLLQTAVGLGLGPFDLIVVDEAHKSRGRDTGLWRLLEQTLATSAVSRRLCMTATPVELGAADWDQSLERIRIDPVERARIRPIVDGYVEAVRRVRLGWRSSVAARDTYVTAAQAFEGALKPYVLRRGKRRDEAVALFRATSSVAADMDGYRWQHEVPIAIADLDGGWRRAVCAAEALSFVAHGGDDPASKRLRLTFANGHGIATRLDASAAGPEDAAVQPGDTADVAAKSGEASDAAPPSLAERKRIARAAWWQGVIDRTAGKPGALQDHPALLAAVQAIEGYDARGEKVLVFGRFTGPMRALVGLLNARAMLRALDAGTPWPQGRIGQDELSNVEAAHRQLGRSGPFDATATDLLLSRQYALVERRREAVRTSVLELILQGLPEAEKDARTLAEAARQGRNEDRAVLAAAMDQLLEGSRRPQLEANVEERGAIGEWFSAEAVAEAFLQLLAALRERDEGDTDGDGALDETEAAALWRAFAERLGEEYGTERGRFARLMVGGTSLSTRRTLQLAFNRKESNPRVLVAQSLVGREGLNLHQACRVVVLLHPEWNPGVVEQQIGRVDRVGSHWSQMLAEAMRAGHTPLPRIEVRPLIFQGTYDAHHWSVLQDRWDDLRAQLHGVVVPFTMRRACTEDEMAEIRRLDAVSPNFEPARDGLE